MYKLLGIDIDGTIINYEQPNITKRVKEAIFRAKKQGVHVVLISGRNYYSMKRFLEELDVKDFGITINGGIVIDLKSGEKIFETYLDEEIARGLTNIFIQEKVAYAVFAGLNAYAVREFEKNPTVEYLKNEKDNVIVYDDTEDFLSTIKTNKFIAMTDDKNLEKLTQIIKEKYGDKVYVEYGFSGLIEIYPIGMNKGVALQSLANKLQIPMKKVMTIGDAENDISMLKVAGMGVAMGNAIMNVKDHADFVTKAIHEDGVAHAIDKFIFNI
ncbi:MAG: Cof-type HAD-IIB family hydrolase [Eubacteriaceae bacterium]